MKTYRFCKKAYFSRILIESAWFVGFPPSGPIHLRKGLIRMKKTCYIKKTYCARIRIESARLHLSRFDTPERRSNSNEDISSPKLDLDMDGRAHGCGKGDAWMARVAWMDGNRRWWWRRCKCGVMPRGLGGNRAETMMLVMGWR